MILLFTVEFAAMNELYTEIIAYIIFESFFRIVMIRGFCTNGSRIELGELSEQYSIKYYFHGGHFYGKSKQSGIKMNMKLIYIILENPEFQPFY